MLNIRHWAVFRSVMRTGSVSGAARTLNISQPAVTKTLQLIEDRTGIPLFSRIRGRLQATPEAELLLPEVERLLGDLDAIDRLASEIRDGSAGRITIASSATLTSSLVPAAVVRLAGSGPLIRFEIRALASRHVLDEVRNNQVDLGVLDFPLGDEDFEVHELCCGEVGCVMRVDSPLAKLDHVSPKDLMDERLIGFSEATFTGSMMRDAFRAENVPCQVCFTTNQTFSAYTLVQGGAGIAIVDPFPLLSGAFPDLLFRPFRPIIEIRPRVVLSRSRPVSQVARRFISELTDVTNDMLARSRPLLTRSPNSKQAAGVAA